VWEGKLLAVASVIKGGRTIGLVECDVTDDQDRLVARASSTCMTLRGDAAKGR
jgi:acyl-coenzyme A thioesterase PaaI-like protein